MIDSHEVVEKLFQQLVVSHGKRLDAVSLTEGKFIHNWVKDHHLSATLEVGLAFSASGGHVCIDPYQEKQYLNAGLDNLVRLGYINRHGMISTSFIPCAA
jgi:hypothetical protein